MTQLIDSSIPECPKFEDPRPPYGAPPDLGAAEKFLSHMAIVLHFLSRVGVSLLNQKDPIPFTEWNKLLVWVHRAWFYGAGGECTQSILNLTIERGITSLSVEVKKIVAEENKERLQVLWEDYCSRRPVIGDWIINIEHNLCHERIKDEAVRNHLIALMRDQVSIPLFRAFSKVWTKNPERAGEWFRSLAVNRYPGDRDGQELYMDDCLRRSR